MTDADQELYKNFPLVISERWQNEVAETVFETVNFEADKVEHKRKAKQKKLYDFDEKGNFIFSKSVLIIDIFAVCFRIRLYITRVCKKAWRPMDVELANEVCQIIP